VPLLHSVYFYFKDDADPAEIENQRNSILNDLSRISGADQIWAGAPAGIERDVVDNNYAMSLHIILKDKNSLAAYQADPVHQEFVQRFKPNWKSIKVFDTNV